MNQNQNELTGGEFLLGLGAFAATVFVIRNYAAIDEIMGEVAKRRRAQSELKLQAPVVFPLLLPTNTRRKCKLCGLPLGSRVRPHACKSLKSVQVSTSVKQLVSAPPKQLDPFVEVPSPSTPTKRKRGGRTSMNSATLEKLNFYDVCLLDGIRAGAIAEATQRYADKHRLFGNRRERLRRTIRVAVRKYRT